MSIQLYIYVRGLSTMSGPTTCLNSSTEVAGIWKGSEVADAESGRASSKQPLIHAEKTAARALVEDRQPIKDTSLGQESSWRSSISRDSWTP